METIGDAYMAVGGLHQTGVDHGRWVTAMGIEMIRLAKNVSIPRTNKNIEVWEPDLLNVYNILSFWKIYQLGS